MFSTLVKLLKKNLGKEKFIFLIFFFISILFFAAILTQQGSIQSIFAMEPSTGGSGSKPKATVSNYVVSVKVQDIRGGAIAGATVSLSGGGQAPRSSTSNGSGFTSFIVPINSSGTYYSASASKGGYISSSQGRTLYGSSSFTITLQGRSTQAPGGTSPQNPGGYNPAVYQKLGGRVYYTTNDGSYGLGGVNITIENRHTGNTARMTTNSSGNYLFADLIGTSYKVSVSKVSGYTLVSNNPQYTTVSSGGRSTINFRLQKTSNTTPKPTVSKSIKGLVYTVGSNNSTQGFASVEVTIKNIDTGNIAHKSTNSSGNFSFTGLVGTRYIVSIVSPPGYSTTNNNQTVTLDSSGQATASFRLTKNTNSRSVSGRVYYQHTNGNTVGVSGVKVNIVNTETNHQDSTTTASTGNYAFSGLVGSKYSVNIVTPNGYSLSSANPLSVVLGSNGQATASFRLTKTTSIPNQVSLTVKVRAATGVSAPIPGATLSVCYASSVILQSGIARCQNGTTDNAGEKTFSTIPNTSLTISVSKSGFKTTNQSTTVSSGNKSIIVTLYPNPTPTPTIPSNRFTISGVVTSATDGKPIPGIQVSAISDPQSGTIIQETDSTDASGKYFIATTIRGTFTLRAIPSSNSPFQGSTSYPKITFDTTSNKNVARNFKLTLKAQSRVNLTVKVQAATGITAPLSQVGVNVCYQTPIVIAGKTITCELSGTGNGTQRVFKVQPNTTVEIQAFAVLEPGRNPSNVKKTVSIGTTDKTEVLTLPLSSNSSFNSKIKICVYNNDIIPVPLAANLSITGYSTVNTGSDGCHDYTFTGGKSITVKAEAAGYAPEIKTIVLSKPTMPTQNIYLDKDSTSKTGVIYGRVKDQKGYSVADVTVTVSRNGSVITETSTNNNGYYLTPQLPFGSGYNVSFKKECFNINTYSSLYLNTNVVGLNRTLERVVNSSCDAPSGSAPNIVPTPPSNYPDPENTYTAPDNPDSNIDPIGPNDPYPSILPTPSKTQIPSPSPTPTSSPEPSLTPKNEPTVTPSPVNPTITPTITPGAKSLKIVASVFLHGIGASGDSANPFPPACQTTPRNPTACLSNQNPVRGSRDIILSLSDENGQEVARKSGSATYYPTKGSFEGSIYFEGIPQGNYLMTIWSDNYLHKLLPVVQHITDNQSQIQLAPASLITGDVNSDNILNILDYNDIADCYSDLQPASSCDPSKRLSTDLNDDGKVDQSDLNLFLRDFSVQWGD